MKNTSYQIMLNQLTEDASYQYPASIPCLIFKGNESVDLQDNIRIIDKDVLGQIIYELMKDRVLDGCVPIIISLRDNTINRMESKGVYILDNINNQFIYLFGAKDHHNFFDKIDKVRREEKMNTPLIIGYLLDSENDMKMKQKHAEKLDQLLSLHGNINGKYTLLDYTEEIEFPLLSKNYKLSLLSWVIRDEGVQL